MRQFHRIDEIPSLVATLFARSASSRYSNVLPKEVRVLRMFKDFDTFNAITNDKTLAAEIHARLRSKVTPNCLSWKKDADFRIVQYDKTAPMVPAPDAEALSEVHAFILAFMTANDWELMPRADAAAKLTTFFKEERKPYFLCQ